MDFNFKVFLITLGHIYIGYGLTYYAMTQNTIAVLLDLEDSQNKAILDGIINALLPIGAAIGGLISSSLIHRLLFRKTFMLMDSLGLLISFISIYANFYTLLLSRVIHGLVIGVNCAITIQYIHHIVKVEYYGFYGGVAQIQMMFGLTLGFAIQWICLINNPQIYDEQLEYSIFGFNYWRIIFLIPGLISMFRLISFIIIVNDNLPYEYFEQGQIEKTKQLIIKYFLDKKMNNEQQEYEINCYLNEFTNQIRKGHKQFKLSTIFSFKYRKQTIIGCIFSFGQQWAGINAVNFYAGSILEKMTNNNYTIINLANVINGILSMISAVITSVIINIYGRKKMLLIGNGVCMFTLGGLTLILLFFSDQAISKSFEIISLILLFIFIVGYSLSLGPIFWIYISEVNPPKIIDLINFINWISCASLAQIFPIIANKFDIFYNFGFFAFICFINELLIYYQVIETIGLTKHQIHQKLHGKSMIVDSTIQFQ